MRAISRIAVTGLILLSGVTPPLSAATGKGLSFTRTVELPAIGLKIKLMPEATETPPPSPTAYSYESGRGDGKEILDLYLPIDLWRISQHAGSWRDSQGNVLHIAGITHGLPEGLPRQHVSRKEYEDIEGVSRLSPETWTEPQLCRWVSQYLKAGSAGARQLPKQPFRLKQLLSFRLQGQPANRLVYAFRLNRSASSRHSAAPLWFMTMFDIAPGNDVKAADETIRKQFFASITTGRFVPSAATRARTFQGRTPPRAITRTEEYRASRDQVVASIRNMKDWWYVETDNYIILSNLDSKYRAMVRELQTDIEHFRSAYEQMIPAASKVSAISVIRVFATRDEYNRYVGPEMEWTDGLWVPSKRELLVRGIDETSSKKQREGVFKVVRHEAFHQYLFYAMERRNVSAWINEGHATLFETATVRNGRLHIEEDPDKTALLSLVMKRSAPNLRPLLNMTYKDFYAGDDMAKGMNYTLSWALMYYLRQAAPYERSPKYKQCVSRYMNELQRSSDASKATAAAFADIEIEDLARDLRDFWLSDDRRDAAARNGVRSLSRASLR